MNIAWFPFDEQRCDLVYESWRYPSTELNISVPQEPVTLAHYKTSGEWNLVGTLHAFLLMSAKLGNRTFSQLPFAGGRV